MTPTKIFLDLDDVLNDFTMSALREVGCPVGSFEYEAYDPKWGFDIVRAANVLRPQFRMTQYDFWHRLTREFWENCPLSMEAGLLLRVCVWLVGQPNVCIFTAVKPDVQPAYVAAAKVEWIRKHLPKWTHSQFLIGPQKHFCARSEALLIDDADHNVDAFRAHGGQAILLPRPWNSLHAQRTGPVLASGLEEAFSLKGQIVWAA